MNTPINANQKPKLCLLITRADIGGAQRHVEILARHLVAKFEIEIIHGGGEYFNEKLNSLPIKITEIKSINSYNFVFALFGLYKHLRTSQTDILHTHSTLASVYGRLCGFFLPLKTIYTVHGWFFANPKYKLIQTFGPIVERCLKKSSLVTIFVSKFDMELAKRYKCADMSRAQHIHNAIESLSSNTKSNSSSNEHFKLMFVGRLAFQKDPMLAIKAVELCANEVKLTIFGNGELRKSLEQYIKTNKLEHRIKIITDKNNLDSEYSQHDCLLVTSMYEGMPFSILEAMKHQLPIIAIDTCGLKEMVDNDINGYLLPTRSPQELAKAINKIIADDTLKNELGANSLKKMQECFSLDQFIGSTSKLYFSVINAQ